VPCILSATRPVSNGALLDDQDVTESDWAQCASQVDAVYEYQQKQGNQP